MKNAVRLVAVIAVLLMGFSPISPALAKTSSGDSTDVQKLLQRLEPLEKMIKTQQKALDEQNKKITEQEKELKLYRSKLEAMDRTTESAAPKPYPSETKAGKQVAAAKTVASSRTETSGTPIAAPKKEQEARPQLDVLPSYGGVLTPKGTLMFENSMEYTNTTSNIFSFNGVEISNVVLIGQIQATSARRQLIQNAARVRFGITDRLEADVRVPYVYRNDAETTTVGGAASRTAIEGNGFGDIDLGLAYQLNRGTRGWPYFIGNLRYKSDTGDGPYDVKYDANNVAKSLPTGSGYNTVEGSVTTIKVTDPAVLFGNLGYVYSMGEDVNKTFNNTRILDIEPGSAFNASTGLGFSINQETSFTLGYKHSYVFPTYQHSINTTNNTAIESRSDTLQVGSLMLGASYRFSPVISFNLTTEVGATRDAPDLHVGFRVPIRLGQLY